MEKPAQTSILGEPDKSKRAQVSLKVSATLFDPEMGSFVGRTCVPNGIKMVSKSNNAYSLKTDSAYEIYLFAEPTAKYIIVLDFYLE